MTEDEKFRQINIEAALQCAASHIREATEDDFVVPEESLLDYLTSVTRAFGTASKPGKSKKVNLERVRRLEEGVSPYCGCHGSALALAKQFHGTYERLAPSFGYETRPETRDFNPDSANGRLMIAVCHEIIGQNTEITGSQSPVDQELGKEE